MSVIVPPSLAIASIVNVSNTISPGVNSNLSNCGDFPAGPVNTNTPSPASFTFKSNSAVWVAAVLLAPADTLPLSILPFSSDHTSSFVFEPLR